MEDTECLVDLLDYCHRKITLLLSEEEEEKEEEREEEEGESSDKQDTANPKVDLLKVQWILYRSKFSGNLFVEKKLCIIMIDCENT